MKTWLIGALAVAVLATALPQEAEARRFGGGKSTGLQRNMPARTAPEAPPARPANAAPQQAAPATAGAAPAAAAAGAGRSWMGPIAGLAAGLGIAALMSHLGLGEAFGNFLMLALLAVAGIFLLRFVMRRMGGGQTPAMAGANRPAAGQPGTQARVAWPAAAQPVAERHAAAAQPVSEPAVAAVDARATDAGTDEAAPLARAFVPASFDSEGFSRTAKMIFIRMQAANDSADLDDLRRFTTPELFASLRLDIQERGPSAQTTDVTEVNAEVLDVANEEQRQIVSVRFTGRMVEEAGAEPTAFHEVWHLVRPHDDSRPWAIAGIEQVQ